jgi:phosphomannomutase/phosphoglucomutase
LVGILSNSEKKISEQLADVPTTHTTPEIKLSIDDSVKFETMQKIIDDFSAEFENCDKLDGVRVNFSDGSWGLVRASNTSPILTLRFEANSEERLKEVKEIFKTTLAKHSELDLALLD